MDTPLPIRSGCDASSDHSMISAGKWNGFTSVHIALGILLLVTASLKLYGLSMSTLPAMAWYSTPMAQAIAISWEILLGLWLLSRKGIVGSWLAAICTFVLLAGISAHLGWIGEATCGCFGAIKASPWLAFGVDITVLLLLVISRPPLGMFRTELPRSASKIGWFVLGIGVSFAIVVGAGFWLFGSPEAALARLRVEALTIRPGYVDFGTGKLGNQLEATIEIRNWIDRPVRLIGGTSDCSCVTSIGLPVSVPPRGSVSIPLLLKVRQSTPGVFTREAELWTDCDEQRTIGVRVGCRVE
jgi:hypothetical protein